MKKALISILGIAVGVMGVFFIRGLLSSETVETSKDQKTTILSSESGDSWINAQSLQLPNSLQFCEEEVPLNNEDIRNRLDRELHVNTYWHSQTLLFFKRANRWFPTIDSILVANRVPTDFKYLALIESGLDNVVSPSGAAGFWQFMKSTARGYELEITNSVDERYNVVKATNAACDYLKQAYEKFDSWTLAAASYNMGKGGLNNQLTQQRVTSYYDLHLNNETSRYVPRILAIKLIMESPEEYGFVLNPETLYAPYQTTSISVDSSLNSLVDFAADLDISYRTLKVLNPWLRSRDLQNPEGKTYKILLPQGQFPLDGDIRPAFEEEEETK